MYLRLTHRIPFRPSFSVHLSSSFSTEIAVQIQQRAEFLRPLWKEQPFTFNVPERVEDEIASSMYADFEDYGCFDRTLIAYCASYNIDTSNIRYTIDYACDDAPCFRLLHPASGRNRKYSALELLAVMRALRYNESFVTISFYDINLDVLQDSRDLHGVDFDSSKTRSNSPVNIPGQEHLSVLSQEIRALALKSKRLRRLDFTLCLSRTPMAMHDPGCGIPEALFPLCRRQLTNVDWIVLNGIKLGDADMDYMVDAASQKASHFRALEVAYCGISIHDLDILLSTLTAQENTLEVINISGVQGRLSPELFQQQIGYFAHIRKICLSHISRTSGLEPLIAPETLLNWRLEELSLSHTAVNEQTVDAIAGYLSSPKSRTLRNLRLDQCGLTGKDVAVFLHSMAENDRSPRPIHLHVSENRLYQDYSMLFGAIAKNKTPTHLTMRMMDFQKEDHFRQLVDALKHNTTLKYVDISKASLPYDAGPETCKALQLMFEENSTIEELDISGECAHLDVARFGIGLNLALTGLKKNTSLKVLKIEHQKLGLQGANTLASVLEENQSLLEVYCDHNDINLQSFTVLVNGLQRNKSVLFLPLMNRDRELSLERVRREIETANQDNNHSGTSAASSLRKSVHAAVSGSSRGHRLSKQTRASSLGNSAATATTSTTTSPAFNSSMTSPQIQTNSTTPPHFMRQDVQLLISSLSAKWDAEVSRLQRYLVRNYNLAHGIGVEEVDGISDFHAVSSSIGGNGGADGEENGFGDASSDGRPSTPASLGTFLNQVSIEQEEQEEARLNANYNNDKNNNNGQSTSTSSNSYKTDDTTITALPFYAEESKSSRKGGRRYYASLMTDSSNTNGGGGKGQDHISRFQRRTSDAGNRKTNSSSSPTKSSSRRRPPLKYSLSSPAPPSTGGGSSGLFSSSSHNNHPVPPLPRVIGTGSNGVGVGGSSGGGGGSGGNKSLHSYKSNSTMSVTPSMLSTGTTTSSSTTAAARRMSGRFSETATSLRGLLAARPNVESSSKGGKFTSGNGASGASFVPGTGTTSSSYNGRRDREIFDRPPRLEWELPDLRF